MFHVKHFYWKRFQLIKHIIKRSPKSPNDLGLRSILRLNFTLRAHLKSDRDLHQNKNQ